MLISDYRRVIVLPSGAPEGLASATTNTFSPGGPVDVMRIGVIADSDDFFQTGTSLFEMQCDLYTKASGAAAGYTITTARETVQTGTATDLAFGGNGIYVDVSAAPISMKAGEKIVCRISAGGASSAGTLGSIFIEFRDMAWQGHAAPTSAPGDGAGAGDIVNMTKV